MDSHGKNNVKWNSATASSSLNYCFTTATGIFFTGHPVRLAGFWPGTATPSRDTISLPTVARLPRWETKQAGHWAAPNTAPNDTWILTSRMPPLMGLPMYPHAWYVQRPRGVQGAWRRKRGSKLNGKQGSLGLVSKKHLSIWQQHVIFKISTLPPTHSLSLSPNMSIMNHDIMILDLLSQYSSHFLFMLFTPPELPSVENHGATLKKTLVLNKPWHAVTWCKYIGRPNQLSHHDGRRQPKKEATANSHVVMLEDKASNHEQESQEHRHQILHPVEDSAQ